MNEVVRIGTRSSKLALWQAHHVRDALADAGYQTDVITISTKGDEILDVPLAEIGDKALFTKELDLAMLDGRIDLAVHSLKDLPTTLPDGLELAAVTKREDAGDAFVAHPDFEGGLDDLPQGATIATSSLRRRAHLKAWRADLNVVPVRGNIGTRLQKLDESNWHGMILASAGLIRLGLVDRIRHTVPQEVMIPAVGQGALGIVARQGDERIRTMLRQRLHHEETYDCVTAERAFLRTLEGGCSVPIGAHARADEKSIRLVGSVASLDGTQQFRDERKGSRASADIMGTTLATELLQQGADGLLATFRASRR